MTALSVLASIGLLTAGLALVWHSKTEGYRQDEQDYRTSPSFTESSGD